DPYVKRARILYGGDGSIAYAPGWEFDRVSGIREQLCATIHVVGAADPTVLAGLDPERLGRDRNPTGREWVKSIIERSINWSIGPSPTPVWAAVTHPDLEPGAALDQLWNEIEHICRLDEPDPVAAWTQRMLSLTSVSGAEGVRGRAAVDDGSSRLGEVALVDRHSRIGRLPTVYFQTLLDENAASHIALGNGLDWAVGDEHTDRVNRSEIHIDFMIGSDEVVVT